jgi:hypothetical protein
MISQHAFFSAVIEDRLRVAEQERRARSARPHRRSRPARRSGRRWSGSARVGDRP